MNEIVKCIFVYTDLWPQFLFPVSNSISRKEKKIKNEIYNKSMKTENNILCL